MNPATTSKSRLAILIIALPPLFLLLSTSQPTIRHNKNELKRKHKTKKTDENQSIFSTALSKQAYSISKSAP
jgi:hypothetical protein